MHYFLMLSIVAAPPFTLSLKAQHELFSQSKQKSLL